MALITLPRVNDPGGTPEAQAKLQAAIDEPFTVVIIVYEEGPEVEHVLETCTGRALAKPAIRRVVWCPDPSVLSPEQKKNFWRANKAAVSVGLADTVADALTLKQAQVRILVEGAFLAAEGQTP